MPSAATISEAKRLGKAIQKAYDRVFVVAKGGSVARVKQATQALNVLLKQAEALARRATQEIAREEELLSELRDEFEVLESLDLWPFYLKTGK